MHELRRISIHNTCFYGAGRTQSTYCTVSGSMVHSSGSWIVGFTREMRSTRNFTSNCISPVGNINRSDDGRFTTDTSLIRLFRSNCCHRSRRGRPFQSTDSRLRHPITQSRALLTLLTNPTMSGGTGAISRVQDIEQQLAYVQWRKRRNERAIRETLEAMKLMKQKDIFMMTISRGKSPLMSDAHTDEGIKPLTLTGQAKAFERCTLRSPTRISRSTPLTGHRLSPK